MIYDETISETDLKFIISFLLCTTIAESYKT